MYKHPPCVMAPARYRRLRSPGGFNMYLKNCGNGDALTLHSSECALWATLALGLLITGGKRSAQTESKPFKPFT